MLDTNQCARDLLSFIDQSPTPYHAVNSAKRRLVSAGFSELDEREAWRLSPGDKRFVVRGGGTLVAFALGEKPPSESGFIMVGAHTDSPNLRLKPRADIKCQELRQFGVETYGGVLLSTWLDRDLSLAGRVSLRGGKHHLVTLEGPHCRIPNLAIHLNRDVNKAGLKLNPQRHLIPVVSLTADDTTTLLSLLEGALAKENISFGPKDVLGFDLCLFDTQPAQLGGPTQDLILAPRLDNLASCHAALRALLEAKPAQASQVIAFYDHEEVGSQSAAGAKSRFLKSTLSRIAYALAPDEQSAARAFARSLLVSADMAHAVHPNYADKHDKEHTPRLGRGPVIKINANQSYASDGPGIAVFEEACQAAEVEAQRFVSRNDMPCGSTIGPISAAQMGLRTVDVGNPMWSMHSCRECAASKDIAPMIRAMKTFFENAEIPAPSC